MKSNHAKYATKKKFDGFVPISKIFIDKLPPKPTSDNPKHCVRRNISHPELNLYLRVHAAGHGIDTTYSDSANETVEDKSILFSKRETLNTRSCIKETKYFYYISPYEWTTHFKKFDVKRAVERKYGCNIDGLIRSGRLTLADFPPIQAPFVPNIIRVLVNKIETERFSSWEIISENWPAFEEEAKYLFGHLLFFWQKRSFIERLVKHMHPKLKLETLRIFLKAFKQKPLHLNRQALLMIIENPLYDRYLRPNNEIKSIVRNSALQTSRTNLDTLSFLMVHLYHICVSSDNPPKARGRVSRIYGPLIISFSEKPIIINNFERAAPEESVLLEVILEVCNFRYWNHLSMLQIGQAFDNITDLELRQNLQGTKKLANNRNSESSSELDSSDFSSQSLDHFDNWSKMPLLLTRRRTFDPKSALALRPRRLVSRHRHKDVAEGPLEEKTIDKLMIRPGLSELIASNRESFFESDSTKTENSLGIKSKKITTAELITKIRSTMFKQYCQRPFEKNSPFNCYQLYVKPVSLPPMHEFYRLNIA